MKYFYIFQKKIKIYQNRYNSKVGNTMIPKTHLQKLILDNIRIQNKKNNSNMFQIGNKSKYYNLFLKLSNIFQSVCQNIKKIYFKMGSVKYVQK